MIRQSKIQNLKSEDFAECSGQSGQSHQVGNRYEALGNSKRKNQD